jgi:small GTP-binding protein
MSNAERHYTESQMAVETALAQLVRCSEEEKQALQAHFAGLREMATKLATGRVDIVIFGEIDTGKSALINALIGKPVAPVSVIGGKTRSVGRWTWERCGYRVPGFAQSEVRLIDTPGINEVNGEERARMAREAANRADLILFLTDSDLTDVECSALRELRTTGRPMLLVFNKIDLYSAEQRKELRDNFLRRLEGLIGPEDVLEVQADPLPREYIIVREDGTETSEFRKPPPRVNAVYERALAILERDGKALLALNASLFAADVSESIAATKVRLRNSAAEATIISYAALKGVAVAANPVPVADVLGGTAVDATMVVHLGSLYGIELTTKNAGELVGSIAAAAGAMTGIEWLTSLAVGVLGVVSMGSSLLVTALPQAMVAGFGSYVVGQASKRYFELGASWGTGGPKQVVAEILGSIDENSVMARLREAILTALKTNRHARSRPSAIFAR